MMMPDRPQSLRHRAGTGEDMGTIVAFPADRRPSPGVSRSERTGRGNVVILPVIRIERMPDDSTGPSASRRKRRRRVARS